MALTRASAGSYPMDDRRRAGLVYEKPPAVNSDQADYHTAAQWHLCTACRESWLCREHHAHGHPGCPGKPLVLQTPRKPWPADWPREGDDA